MKARGIPSLIPSALLLLTALAIAQAPPAPPAPPPEPSPAVPPAKVAPTFTSVVELARRPSIDQGNTGTCWRTKSAR